MPKAGDFFKAENSHYKKWQELHNGASSQNIIDLVNSESFRVWLESHPDGQVDDYLVFLQEENSYFTSPAYRIEYLRKELKEVESENSKLRNEVEVVNEKLHSKTIDFYITCGISSISIFITIFLFVKIIRLKRFCRNKSL